MSAHLLLAVFLFILHFSLFIIPAYAANASVPQFTEVSKESWNAFDQTTFSFLTITNALTCLGMGSPFGGKGCPTLVIGNGGLELKREVNGASGGAMGTATKMMATIYTTQPASGIQYLASGIKQGINFVSPAYAQTTIPGSGNAAISPILNLWKAMRNIAYLLMILILLVIGLMIMFRKRLSQNAVVGIQNALPGIIVALILIQLSYFIASFIVDIGFFLSQLVGSILFQALDPSFNLPNSVSKTQNILNNYNLIQIMFGFAFNPNLLNSVSDVSQTVGSIFGAGNYAIGGLAGLIGGCVMSGPLCPYVAPVTGLVGAVGVNQIVSGIVIVIFMIAILSSILRLLQSLITAYVTIVLQIIFGPLLIMASAIPGQGGLLSYWWRGILANVLIFPSVFAVFILTAALLNMREPWNVNSGITDFTQTMPLFGGFQPAFIRVILAYGLIMIAPGIPDKVKELMKTPDDRTLSGAFKQSLGQGQAGATALGTKVLPGAVGLIRRLI